MVNETQVLLISPPLFRLHGRMQAAPPLGLLYIARYLNEKGINTKVYNADYEGEFVLKESYLAKHHQRYLKNLYNPNFEAWNAVRKIIKKHMPEIVGITTVTSSYISALNIAKIVKEELPNTKVILGGAHVTALPEESASKPEVDAVVIGEGEETMLEIARERKYKDIKGLCFKHKKGIIKTQRRELIKDIDTLPFPRIEDMIFEKTKKGSFSEILSSRGCPYNCTFCASALLWGRHLRLRRPEKIYEEMLFRKERYGLNHFQFWDDALTINKERILTVCKHIRKLGVTWSCQTRADQLSEEVVKAMKRSGCREIALGIESGNQRVLDIAKKNLKVEDVRNAVKLMKKEGIRLIAYFIFGLPGENEESIRDTFELVKEIKPDIISSHIATPLPGTEFFDLAENNKWLIDKNWANYYFVGRTDSMVNLPTIEREKVVKAYLALQKMGDDARTRSIRKKFLNPSFIFKNISVRDLSNPSELWRKIRIFYSGVKG